MYLFVLCMKYCVLVWVLLYKVLIFNVIEFEINNGVINGWLDVFFELIKNRFINICVVFILIVCMLYCFEWSFFVLWESFYKL